MTNIINFLNYIFVKYRLKWTRIVVQCLWRPLDRETIKGIIWNYVKNCVNRGDWRFWHLSSRQKLIVLCITSQFNLEPTCYFCKYRIPIKVVVTFLLLTFMKLMCVLWRDSYWQWQSPSITQKFPCRSKDIRYKAHEHTLLPNNTIGSVLRYLEVGRAKDVSAHPPMFH